MKTFISGRTRRRTSSVCCRVRDSRGCTCAFNTSQRQIRKHVCRVSFALRINDSWQTFHETGSTETTWLIRNSCEQRRETDTEERRNEGEREEVYVQRCKREIQQMRRKREIFRKKKEIRTRMQKG